MSADIYPPSPLICAPEPWSTADPETGEAFEEYRPDVWPTLPPKEQLNPQAREALNVFDKADKLRASPTYEIVQATSRLLVKEAVYDSIRQFVEEIVNENVESGRVSPEEAEREIEEYTELCNRSHRSNHVDIVGTRVLQNKLPRNSPLSDFLQPGSSDIGRLCILEALGFNEENIRGCVVFGSKDEYNWEVRESEKFFDLPEEEQEKQLRELLNCAKKGIARKRAEAERREAAAAYKEMFGGDESAAVEWFESHAESLQQGGYTMAAMVDASADLVHKVEDIQLVKGSLTELRQVFPGLCYPSGLNALDYLSEKHTDSTDTAVLVGAHVLGTGKVYKLGSSLATIYIKTQPTP